VLTQRDSRECVDADVTCQQQLRAAAVCTQQHCSVCISVTTNVSDLPSAAGDRGDAGAEAQTTQTCTTENAEAGVEQQTRD